MKLDLGELLLVFGEDLWQNIDAGGFISGNQQLPAGYAIQFIHGGLSLTPEFQDLLGELAEDLSCGGEGDAAAETVK